MAVAMGFIDGGFNSVNSSYCSYSFLNLETDIANITSNISSSDLNKTVYYSSQLLKLLHPFAYHCYFTGKESYYAAKRYLQITSP